jgi:hypothetical protein
MSSAIATTEPLAPEFEPVPVAIPTSRPGRFRRAAGFIGSAGEWVFGVAALLLGLAVLASVPVGQFLALGYVLEASGRVARSGRIRDGFIGVRTAARFGGVALAACLLWLPLYGMSLMAESARIIDPNGPIARQWELGLSILTILFALHVTGAILRGARFRDFLRPLNILWLVQRALRGGLYGEARDRFWNTFSALRLPYYFWLGVRGFVGAFLWLIVPLVLMAQGHRIPALGVLGAILLAIVVLYVPFMQVRFARDNRFRAFREIRQTRAEFRGAPIAFAIALGVHLLLAMPLYLLKIEVIPRDLVFLEGLVFLLFILPARLLDGWAVARSARRDARRHWLSRWMGRFLMLPIVIAYVLVVFTSPHLGWHGIGSLYEQHAFLLPVPFVTWKG